MSQLVASVSRSPRFWMIMVFFLLPLVAAPVLDWADQPSENAQTEQERWFDGPWTPVPADATTDGTIIVRKVAYPRNTQQEFTFFGSVSGTIGNGGRLTVTDLPAPGTYTSQEQVPQDWRLNSIQCDDGSLFFGTTAVFFLDPAQTIECTFYNQEMGSEPCQDTAGRWPFGPSHALDIDGDALYLGSGGALVTVDVSSPSNPQQIGSVDLWAPLSGVDAGANYIYATTSVGYDGALFVVDSTDPANPQALGQAYAIDPTAVEVAGTYAYVASGGGDLLVFDVATPSDPVFVASADVIGSPLDVRLAGDLAFLAAGNGGLRVVDISDPTTPSELSGLPLIDYAYGVDVVGRYAYVAAESGGLRIIDVFEPANPIEIGFFVTGLAYDVTVIGDLAYLADWFAGIMVFDVSDPTDPEYVGEEWVPGSPRYIVSADDHVFVAAVSANLQVVDVSTPANPDLVGSLTYPTSAHEAAIVGDFAYLTLGYDGNLMVFDITDPSAPTLSGPLPGTAPTYGIDVHGDLAYLAAWNNGIKVVDVQDPSTPSVIGGAVSTGRIRSVAAEGSHVYAADYLHDSLRVFDVSNPASPFEIASAPVPDSPMDVVADGANAYVAAGDAGIIVFDISNPAAPNEIGSIATPGSAEALVLRDETLFVADLFEGLRVVDVSNPADPVEIASYDTGFSTDIAIQGNRVYVAGYSVVSTIDVSDPNVPIRIESYAVASPIAAVAAGRGLILVPQSEIELEIMSGCGRLMTDDFETGTFQYWSRVVGEP